MLSNCVVLLAVHIKKSAIVEVKTNYNAKLIDSIAVKAFSKYEWGPSAYYDSVILSFVRYH